MYEVLFNTIENQKILRKSSVLPEFREDYCLDTEEKIAAGKWPQSGYFRTRADAKRAIRKWYGDERKSLLEMVRYCRKQEKLHSK